MIIVTGDTHREDILPRFSSIHKRSTPDTIIVLGDFGLVWTGTPDRTEKYILNWLDNQPWITLAVLGNHEHYERIYNLPLVDLYGGKAYKVSDKVYYLQHGHVFTIENKKFFVFGGASSIDKVNRTNRVSWWEEEIPTTADVNRGVDSLKRVNTTVDYVLTHTAPTEVIKCLREAFPQYCIADGKVFQDDTTKMLDTFLNIVTFKHWYFGHMHVDQSFSLITHDNQKHSFTALYYKSIIIP